MEPLAKIFGTPARLKMLRLFLYNQTTGFTLADIAARAKLSSDAVKAELSDLLAADLLRKKGARAAAKYQVNPRFEHLAALDAFIRDTTNIRPADILALLKRAGSLRFVALTGIFMSEQETPADILIVGDALDERALANAIRSLEAELGREIRYASFPTADFRYRLGVYDRLLRDIFDYPHRVLMDKIGV